MGGKIVWLLAGALLIVHALAVAASEKADSADEAESEPKDKKGGGGRSFYKRGRQFYGGQVDKRPRAFYRGDKRFGWRPYIDDDDAPESGVDVAKRPGGHRFVPDNDWYDYSKRGGGRMFGGDGYGKRGGGRMFGGEKRAGGRVFYGPAAAARRGKRPGARAFYSAGDSWGKRMGGRAFYDQY